MELKKANTLLDEWEKIKVNLELEVHEERRNNAMLKEEMASKEGQIHEMQ